MGAVTIRQTGQIQPIGYVRYSVKRNKYRGSSARREALTAASIDEMETSRANQKQLIADFCAARGWLPPIWVEDLGRSGTMVERRPGLLQAAALVAEGRAQVVVAKSLSRFARSPRFVDFVQQRLMPHGASVATVTEALDFISPSGELLANIMLSVLKFYCSHTGEQIRESNALLKRQGFWTGGLMFGTRPGEVPGVPEPDPDTWPLLLECFERAARGQSDHSTAKWIRGLGVAGIYGGELTPKSVRGMLSSTFYVDEHLRHDCKVPRDVWDAAQRQVRRRGRPPEDDHALLSGLVVNGWLLQGGKPAPMYSMPNAEGRRYHLTRANHYVEWPAKRHPEAPARALVGVRQDWLDGLVLARVEQLCAEDGSGLLQRAASSLQASARSGIETDLAAARRALRLSQRAALDAKRRITQAFDKGLDDLAVEYKADLDAARLAQLRAQEEVDRLEAAQAAVGSDGRGAEEARGLRLVSVESAQENLNLARELLRLGDYEGLRRLLRLLLVKVELRLHTERGHGWERFGQVIAHWSPALFRIQTGRPDQPPAAGNSALYDMYLPVSSRRT